MYKRLRYLLLIGVAIIAVAAVIRFRMSAPSRASAASADSSAPTSDTFVVKPGDVLVTVTASGPIQANQNASLSFSVTGKVVSMSVNEGDHVLKGQTLATLDNVTAMDSLLLAQAKLDALQLALHRLTDPPSQVDLNVAKAALSLAQAQLTTAQGSV